MDLLPSDSKYWLVFERRPIFNEEKFNTDIESLKAQSESITSSTILSRVKLFRGVGAKLSYGALTSINAYHSHPEYYFEKRTEWTVRYLS